MQLKKKIISAKGGEGFVVLSMQTDEDAWHAYNLIAVGDVLKAPTRRSVKRESATGSVSKSRMWIKVSVEVVEVSFDPETCTVHVKGRNIEQHEHVRMGAHHTVDLEKGQDFTLTKQEWDTMYLERLEEATNPVRSSDLAAVVIEEGLAHVCLVSDAMTSTRARIEENIPKKRQGSDKHKKAMQRFFNLVYTAVRDRLDYETVKVVLLAGPGFVKDDFFQYLTETSSSGDMAADRLLAANRQKFVLAHASSGRKRAIGELLAEPAIRSKLTELRVSDEASALDEFFTALARTPDRVCYGLQHVQRANAQLAIATLLVTDALFRSSNVQTRKTYVDLVESVRANGGVVRIFSSMHVTGERLNQCTGVAAILRFPLPEEAHDEEQKGEEGHADEDEEAEGAAERDLWFPPRRAGGGGGEERKSEERDQAAEDIEEMGL